MTAQRERPPVGRFDAGRLGRLVLAAVLGAAVLVLGVIVDPRRTAFAYLIAFAWATSIVLGALALLMLMHVIGARWFIPIRRLAESIVGALPALAVLFLPLLFGVGLLYRWTTPDALDAHAREIVLRKSVWLNVPFFAVRAAVYFASWIGMGLLLRRWSERQDREPGERLASRLRAWSAPGLILFAFTITFAGFDWLMSLAPTWYSTIFGVQIFAGGMVGALALLSVWAAALGRGPGRLAGWVGPAQYAALGKLLLTFVIFWFYVSFSQLLIIWIGDIPEEVTWYEPRLIDAWGGFGIVLLVGHFVVPLLLLLSYRLKRDGRSLAWVGGWLLAMHYLDLYWIVLPSGYPAGLPVHWTDPAAVVVVAATAAAWALWRAAGAAVVPIGDPDLEPAAGEAS